MEDRSVLTDFDSIHDEWDNVHRAPRARVERRAAPPPLSSLSRHRSDRAAREPHPDTPRPTDLPTQNHATEAMRSPNFYPITWRVVGGGVMMGGQREYQCNRLFDIIAEAKGIGEVCQEYMAGRCHEGNDCKYAHPGGLYFYQ